jgi:hypothetical protein
MSAGLQLVVRWNGFTCMLWMWCCITCRYDYFGNSTYEISQKSTVDVLEDQMNVTKSLTEAPNQSSEDIDISDFSPTSKGKPRTYPTILFTLQSTSIIIISCIKSRNWCETLDAWILGIQCNAPESLTDRCSANRAGKSRVISCHSRDIGVVMITFLLSL